MTNLLSIIPICPPEPEPKVPQVFDLKPTSALWSGCLKSPAHLSKLLNHERLATLEDKKCSAVVGKASRLTSENARKAGTLCPQEVAAYG
ncbi:MAG: hypothetical protein JO279_18185 [Verrucomicrobia bacterium]|nr:hypothetical protein [Verrucomicrobiota bacterium]